jgi:predicted GIY-YIG superfamily endonuclease
MTTSLPKKRFTVYAIRLAPGVLQSKRFREANPDYVDGMDCYYVGMTARDPKERYAQHLAGYKSNRFAKKYGVELMPPEFTVIKPRTYEEACRLERRIARRLRRQGYGVWQN